MSDTIPSLFVEVFDVGAPAFFSKLAVRHSQEYVGAVKERMTSCTLVTMSGRPFPVGCRIVSILSLNV